MALSDTLHDLEHLIADSMGSALDGARRALAEQIHRRSESGLRDARERGFRDLREATARLDGARTQADVLTALLEEGGRFASRTALLLTFADGARGWAAFGFAAEAEGIEDLRLSYDDGALSRLAEGRGAVSLSAEECADLARHLGGGTPSGGVLVPLVLRDRVAAALYADQLRASDPFIPAALQLLVFTAAQVLEAQGGRERATTPTLTLAESADGSDAAASDGLPLWDPAAMEGGAQQPQNGAAAAASAVPEPPPPAAAATFSAAAAAPSPPVSAPPPPAWHEPAWQAPAAEPAAAPEAAVEETPASPVAAATPEPATAPAPWEELPEEPEWAAPPEAPPAVEEPAAAAPAWQPAWQMEEAPALETPAPPAPETPAPAVAAEEAWVYTDQGYEAEPEQTYEGAAIEDLPEEIPVEASFDDTAALTMDETGIDATVVEEVAAEPVDDEAVSEDTSPWQTPAAASHRESPESTTSPLYGAPLYPSEATVRISRDMLQGAGAQPTPAAADADVSEDSTVMLQRPALSPAAPAPPPLDEPPARASPPPPRSTPVFGGGGGSSTEVQPPPDLEGPGWAFRSGEASTASYRQQNDESSALHEEARRLARLLVSEIKLYNEEQIEEGRRQRDIYPRLQDDIDRSRQMYEERVDPAVRHVDYFHQEMINILAGGDAGALGM